MSAPPPYAAPVVQDDGRALVTLHVYDVTNAPSATANSLVSAFNRFAKDGLGIGGIFHGGVEVHGREWSFGACEGAGVTGVYPCEPGKNCMYTYREALTLGTTALSPAEVDALIARLKPEWTGESYHLLQKNCVNFCEAFAAGLGCTGAVPGWMLSLAAGASAAADGTKAAVSKAKSAVAALSGLVSAGLAAAQGSGGGNGSGGGGGGGK